MVQIRDMDMPTNCAHCPCLTVTADGVRCGTPTGKDQKICADSLYFDEHCVKNKPEPGYKTCRECRQRITAYNRTRREGGK